MAGKHGEPLLDLRAKPRTNHRHTPDLRICQFVEARVWGLGFRVWEFGGLQMLCCTGPRYRKLREPGKDLCNMGVIWKLAISPRTYGGTGAYRLRRNQESTELGWIMHGQSGPRGKRWHPSKASSEHHSPALLVSQPPQTPKAQRERSVRLLAQLRGWSSARPALQAASRVAVNRVIVTGLGWLTAKPCLSRLKNSTWSASTLSSCLPQDAETQAKCSPQEQSPRCHSRDRGQKMRKLRRTRKNSPSARSFEPSAHGSRPEVGFGFELRRKLELVLG